MVSVKPVQSLPAPTEQEVAPLEEVAPVAPSAPSTPVGQVIAGCGDNSYATFIYMHESGCNTAAQNSIGCLGIGQACPGSKLLNVCPGLDYACENSFFTNYANSAYGGWEQAYNAWVSKGWW